jgi:hypothetical protein
MMVRVSRGFSSLDDNNDERKETINGNGESERERQRKKINEDLCEWREREIEKRKLLG